MTPTEQRHAAELREIIRQNAADAFNESQQWRALACAAIMAALIEGIAIVYLTIKVMELTKMGAQ